jgi:hypothetical protein
MRKLNEGTQTISSLSRELKINPGICRLVKDFRFWACLAVGLIVHLRLHQGRIDSLRVEEACAGELRTQWRKSHCWCIDQKAIWRIAKVLISPTNNLGDGSYGSHLLLFFVLLCGRKAGLPTQQRRLRRTQGQRVRYVPPPGLRFRLRLRSFFLLINFKIKM